MTNSQPADIADIMVEQQRLGDGATKLAVLAGVVGLAFLALGAGLAYWQNQWAAFFRAYLTNFMFFLSLSLGAMFFVLIHHATRAGWSVVVRRLAEVIAANVAWLTILVLPMLIFGMGPLYDWLAASADPLLAGKRPYLNQPFFVVRMIVYFGTWVLIARYFLNKSVQQDQTGEVGLTVKMQQWSNPALVAYALTVTFAAVDLAMSRTTDWYSTIYGVYFFSGGVVGFQAFIILLVAALQAGGKLKQTITVEHYHDLGKLLFAYTVFWAYIAYSQYMLIWYSNIPEETFWYLARQTGPWVYVSLFVLFGGFVFPFLGLISRIPKRKPVLLIIGAIWLLAAHWVDVFWLTAPAPSPEGRLNLGWWTVTTFIGLAGLFAAGLIWRMKSCALVPQRDPRLSESVSFENI